MVRLVYVQIGQLLVLYDMTVRVLANRQTGEESSASGKLEYMYGYQLSVLTEYALKTMNIYRIIKKEGHSFT